MLHISLQKLYIFLEQIVPQLPPTSSAQESNDESQDPNILFGISSDELEKNLDSGDVGLTDDLLAEQEMETDAESEKTTVSDVNRFV